MIIINTIIGRYHNIKINFFYSRPLFLIWYRNEKERKHADRAAFEKKAVARAFFKYSFVKVVDAALALFKIMQATRLEMHHLKNSLNSAGDHF